MDKFHHFSCTSDGKLPSVGTTVKHRHSAQTDTNHEINFEEQKRPTDLSLFFYLPTVTGNTMFVCTLFYFLAI